MTYASLPAVSSRMRAFVTGGSGFLGRNLIAAIVRAGGSAVALARSDDAARAVEAAGATPARGDLDDAAALARSMGGCDVVFHAAALMAEWAPDAEWTKHNVDGTRRVLEAAVAAGVRRLVHVSTEAAFADGRTPLVRLTEAQPLPERPLRGYPASKAAAERVVRAAQGIEAMVIRPRLIWGAGDTSLLPKLVSAVRAGKFAWVGGGTHLTSTCHVDNVCEGALLAAERGAHGEAYFLKDGEDVVFKDFITALLTTHGVAIPDRSVPRRVADLAARAAEALWTALSLPGAPPATRTPIALFGQEVTVVDEKARRELGYAARTTRAAGLAAMRDAT